MNTIEQLFSRVDNLVAAGGATEAIDLLKAEILRLTEPVNIIDLPISEQSITEEKYGVAIYQHYPNHWVAFNKEGEVLFSHEDHLEFVRIMEAKKHETPPLDPRDYMSVHTSQLAWLVYKDEQSSEDA